MNEPVRIKVPVSQKSSLVNGKFEVVSTEYIEVDEKVFAERMAELFNKSFN
jgi:hypothetical protein